VVMRRLFFSLDSFVSSRNKSKTYCKLDDIHIVSEQKITIQTKNRERERERERERVLSVSYLL
jgi:hypothetical protein